MLKKANGDYSLGIDETSQFCIFLVYRLCDRSATGFNYQISSNEYTPLIKSYEKPFASVKVFIM